MNNLEQANRLADSFQQQNDLLQSRGAQRQLQPEKRADLSLESLLPTRRHLQSVPDDAGGVFLLVQTAVPKTKFGLSDSLSGQLTISCYVSAAYPQTAPRRAARFSYEKNGILVNHAGRVITSKDVEDALAEE